MQEAAALIDGLLMGIDFPNILQFCPRCSQQVVVHLQPEGADNVEIVLDHQIVHLGHRACGGILNGQDTILAQPLLDGLEDPVKSLEIENHGIFDDLFAGKLGVGPFNALAGYLGLLREELGCLLNGLADLLIKGAVAAVALGLIAAAQLEEHGVQRSRVGGHFRAGLLRHVLKLFPLPGGHENGQIVGLFVVCYLGGNVHAAAKQLDDFVINFVNLASQFR